MFAVERPLVEGDFDQAYVGMRFVGDNKRGPVRWQTECVVTAAEPGRRFAFDVERYGFGRFMVPVRIATWAYDFEPVDGGTRVTETWTDGRTGWLCADESDMAAKLLTIDRIDRAECRADVGVRFSTERMAREHAELYARVLSSRA